MRAPKIDRTFSGCTTNTRTHTHTRTHSQADSLTHTHTGSSCCCFGFWAYQLFGPQLTRQLNDNQCVHSVHSGYNGYMCTHTHTLHRSGFLHLVSNVKAKQTVSRNSFLLPRIAAHNDETRTTTHDRMTRRRRRSRRAASVAASNGPKQQLQTTKKI